MEIRAPKLNDSSGKIIGFVVIIAAVALGVWYFMTQTPTAKAKAAAAASTTPTTTPSFVPTTSQPFDPQTASFSTLVINGNDLPCATANGISWVMVGGWWILATQYNPVINGYPTVSDMSYISAHGG